MFSHTWLSTFFTRHILPSKGHKFNNFSCKVKILINSAATACRRIYAELTSGLHEQWLWNSSNKRKISQNSTAKERSHRQFIYILSRCRNNVVQGYRPFAPHLRSCFSVGGFRESEFGWRGIYSSAQAWVCERTLVVLVLYSTQEMKWVGGDLGRRRLSCHDAVESSLMNALFRSKSV